MQWNNHNLNTKHWGNVNIMIVFIIGDSIAHSLALPAWVLTASLDCLPFVIAIVQYSDKILTYYFLTLKRTSLNPLLLAIPVQCCLSFHEHSNCKCLCQMVRHLLTFGLAELCVICPGMSFHIVLYLSQVLTVRNHQCQQQGFAESAWK